MANEKRLIELGEALRMIQNSRDDCPETSIKGRAIWETAHKCALSCLTSCPTVDAVPVNTVVEMFEYFLGDCPCDYSPTDVWLPECCELQEECPNPADEHGCWKQFIKQKYRRD